MKKKHLLVWVMALAMAAGTIGCSTPSTSVQDQTKAPEAQNEQNDAQGEGQEADAAGEKIFRYSNTVDIATIDPNKSNAVADSTVSYHLYDGLYRNVQGDLQPATATSYDVTDDGLVYTFHLREDAKWSDGEPVTAKDFEYGMKRLCDPAAACPMSYLGAVLKNGNAVTAGEKSVDELGVKVIDDYTLEITLENPADYFVSMTSMACFAPVREDKVEEYGEQYGSAADKAVYNGPFVCSEYGNGKLVMEKNENYYAVDQITLDGVELLTIADNNTAVSMFDAGELDLVEVPSELAAQYEGKTLSYYSGADDYAALNHNNEYLANKNFRLALNYALNREEYNLLAHNGLYEANQRYVLPQVRGVEQDYGTEYPLEAFPLQNDMDKANEYMTAAMQELGVSDPSEISLKLVVSDTDTAKKEAEIVANQWTTNLGIKIDINMVPGATRNAMLIPNNDEFDIIMTGWAPDYSDPYSYLELWHSESQYNYLNYHSDAYDGYLDASKTTRGEERMENLYNAEKTLLEDGALVPLQLREVQYMVSDRVQNLGAYFIGLNYDYMYADITE
ncbi:MAG: peptide ABC transporter substrate-binding protein [Clostridiales bacterium]|nr:peptide ABC transporter substrate-binding protein [Clostridiales bacterium]